KRFWLCLPNTAKRVVITVSARDAHLLRSAYTWRLKQNENGSYSVIRQDGTCGDVIGLAQTILCLKANVRVTHNDGDSRNFKRENLRITSWDSGHCGNGHEITADT